MGWVDDQTKKVNNAGDQLTNAGQGLGINMTDFGTALGIKPGDVSIGNTIGSFQDPYTSWANAFSRATGNGNVIGGQLGAGTSGDYNAMAKTAAEATAAGYGISSMAGGPSAMDVGGGGATGPFGPSPTWGVDNPAAMTTMSGGVPGATTAGTTAGTIAGGAGAGGAGSSWAPALITSGASLIGGYYAANAAQKAGQTQADAANHAADLQAISTAAQLKQQSDMYNANVTREQPWVTQGTQAGGRLADLMGTSGNTGAQGYGQLAHQFNKDDLTNGLSPSYQFMLDQGNQNMAASAAARGGLMTGQFAKDATKYNQDYASTGYQQAFDNYQTQQNALYNKLSGISSLGQNAAAGVGNQGVQVSGNMANTAQQGTSAVNNLITGGAAASAAGTVGAANAWNNAIGQGANTYMTLAGYNSGRNTNNGTNNNYSPTVA